jgi:hypothetical protein
MRFWPFPITLDLFLSVVGGLVRGLGSAISMDLPAATRQIRGWHPASATAGAITTRVQAPFARSSLLLLSRQFSKPRLDLPLTHAPDAGDGQ